MKIVRESLDNNTNFIQGDSPYKSMSIGKHRPWKIGDKIQILEPIWIYLNKRYVKSDISKSDISKSTRKEIFKYHPSIIKGDILEYLSPAWGIPYFYKENNFVFVSLKWIEKHPNTYIKINDKNMP